MHENDLDSIERSLIASENLSTRAVDVDPSIKNTSEYSSVLAAITAVASELRVSHAPATLELPITTDEFELLISRLQGSINREQLPLDLQNLSKKRFILLKKPNSAATMLAAVTGRGLKKVAADRLEMHDLRRILSIDDIACMLIQLHRTNPLQTMKQLHRAVTFSYRCWPEQITQAFCNRCNNPFHPSPLMRDASMVVDDDDDVKSAAADIEQQLNATIESLNEQLKKQASDAQIEIQRWRQESELVLRHLKTREQEVRTLQQQLEKSQATVDKIPAQRQEDLLTGVLIMSLMRHRIIEPNRFTPLAHAGLKCDEACRVLNSIEMFKSQVNPSYEAITITEASTTNEIDIRVRRLSARVHPDKFLQFGFDNADTTTQTQTLNKCKEDLINFIQMASADLASPPSNSDVADDANNDDDDDIIVVSDDESP